MKIPGIDSDLVFAQSPGTVVFCVVEGNCFPLHIEYSDTKCVGLSSHTDQFSLHQLGVLQFTSDTISLELVSDLAG